MKQLLKKILPDSCVLKIHNFLKNRQIRKCFLYDYARYVRYSNNTSSEKSLLALISNNCHAIEKGFTMPDFRLGFGVSKLQDLLPLCKQYIAQYGKESAQFRKIVQVLYEYRLCHEQHNAEMPPEIAGDINSILAEFPDVTSSSIQIDTDAESFFSKSEAPFPVFSKSRHSVRNFTDEPVPMEKVREAIRLAQLAPSACNRQPARVIIVTDKKVIAKIFSMHGGNRGFGHTVDKLLLIAGYLPGYRGELERNWSFLDVGIFAMNLAYALHYYKIGAVVLNWAMQPERNAVLYPLLDIPEDWCVSLLIAIGNVPQKFKVCSSPKKSLEDIILER